MASFDFLAVDSVAAAHALLRERPEARLIAGGTTLLDLIHAGIEAPALVVDISRLPLAAIELRAGGELRIGALARNADVAADPTVAARFPVLAQALAAGASPQLRNMATVGGNLLQRTRCAYFRSPWARCNRRVPGSGCDALAGAHRTHAILGTSEHCIATHPGDMAVALAALDADVLVAGTAGERTIPLGAFYRLPGDEPAREHVLEPGDLIVAVELRPLPVFARSGYLKLRDRASYDFALVSVAAALEIVDGRVRDVRLALGGVGTIPWRAREAEEHLRGEPATTASFAAAAGVALDGAAPRPDNAFKVELARRAIVRALATLADAR
jgi:xanthine dehydrogenase YagS FAD-binding subunit